MLIFAVLQEMRYFMVLLRNIEPTGLFFHVFSLLPLLPLTKGFSIPKRNALLLHPSSQTALNFPWERSITDTRRAPGQHPLQHQHVWVPLSHSQGHKVNPVCVFVVIKEVGKKRQAEGWSWQNHDRPRQVSLVQFLFKLKNGELQHDFLW